MKKLLNLKTTQILGKTEQQNIRGGLASNSCEIACNEGSSNPLFFICFCGFIDHE